MHVHKVIASSHVRSPAAGPAVPAAPEGSLVFVCFPSFLLLTLQEQYVHAGDLNTDVPKWLGAESCVASCFFFPSNPDPADIELRAFIITCTGIFLFLTVLHRAVAVQPRTSELPS